jgi:hypothetical protein
MNEQTTANSNHQFSSHFVLIEGDLESMIQKVIADEVGCLSHRKAGNRRSVIGEANKPGETIILSSLEKPENRDLKVRSMQFLGLPAFGNLCPPIKKCMDSSFLLFSLRSFWHKSNVWLGNVGRTSRIRRRRAGSVDDTTDAIRAVACIRFVRRLTHAREES